MKTPCLALPLLALALAGCAAPAQRASLTKAQATTIAIQLANEKAASIYQCQPFQDGHPATFKAGLWHWTQLTRNDYEANVELIANGTPNQVTVNFLCDTTIPIP